MATENYIWVVEDLVIPPTLPYAVGVQRESDGATISFPDSAEKSPNWVAFTNWIAEGNTPSFTENQLKKIGEKS